MNYDSSVGKVTDCRVDDQSLNPSISFGISRYRHYAQNYYVVHLASYPIDTEADHPPTQNTKFYNALCPYMLS